MAVQGGIMAKQYVLEYAVYIGEKPQHRRVEFPASDDESAVHDAQAFIEKEKLEFPFAPPKITSTLFRLEKIRTW